MLESRGYRKNDLPDGQDLFGFDVEEREDDGDEEESEDDDEIETDADEIEEIETDESEIDQDQGGEG